MSHTDEARTHRALTTIVDLIKEDRRARDTYESVQGLLAELTGAVCAGDWTKAQQVTLDLQHLFGHLGAIDQPGFDSHMFPNPSWETRLLSALDSLGYTAEDVEHLKASTTAPEADPATIRREALRVELTAYARRAEGRNHLILESLRAGISEAETSRLSRVARGTVRTVRGKASSDAPDQKSAPATSPEPLPEQRAAFEPSALFLEPVSAPSP
ncbi:hypothetical protein [Streptomyces sp. NPDC057552]|uniref:hypothetical protein n=1 Tax=Streptomyces sp. NPDC057552 TaxID=3350537 RepID=UPI0036A77368